jgi:hypothetical protein
MMSVAYEHLVPVLDTVVVDDGVENVIRSLRDNGVSNVIWEQADGSWSRGFFAVEGSPDDIRSGWYEFDYSRFEWVRHDAEDLDDAEGSFNGFRPDDYAVFHRDGNEDICSHWDGLFSENESMG